MDPKGKVQVPEARQGIYRSTDPPAYLPSKARHPPDRHKWFRNRRYSQPVRWFRNYQSIQLLLAKMLSCRTDLWHVWLGAIGHRGDFQVIATVSRGGKSYYPDTVRPHESRVFSTFKCALPETCEMGWNPVIIRLRYSTLGRKNKPCWWTIEMTWFWRRLRKTYCITLGNPGGPHCWAIQWSPTSDWGSSGYRSTRNRHEEYNELPWPVENRWPRRI